MSIIKDKPINVGVAGLGRSGWVIHIGMLRKIPDKYNIVAVSDPDKKRQKEAADEFKCNTYSDFDDFLRDPSVELVVVATPSHLHADCSIKALKAGKHVLCEKPFATNLADADRVINVANKTDKILISFQNRRYCPEFLQIRKVIDSGKLGRIIMIKYESHSFTRRWDWQTLKKFGGGLLNNHASHLIDLLLLLFGNKEPEKIFCHMENTVTIGDADDHVKILLKAEGQPLIDLELTYACAYPQQRWLIMGTCGSLTGVNYKSIPFFNELKWRYFNPANLQKREASIEPTHDRSYNTEEIKWKEEVWKAPGGDILLEPLLYNDLYETIRKDKPLSITLESVRRHIVILEKCRDICPV